MSHEDVSSDESEETMSFIQSDSEEEAGEEDFELDGRQESSDDEGATSVQGEDTRSVQDEEDQVDRALILPEGTKRARKRPLRYVDELFRDKDVKKMMMEGVPDSEIEAALHDEDWSDEDESCEDAFGDDASEDSSEEEEEAVAGPSSKGD